MDAIDHVAEAVRTALEQVKVRRPDLNWGPGLVGACSVGSAALVRLLRRRGIPAVFVLGSYTHIQVMPGSVHCWVQVGDEIIDVTATQFNWDEALVRQMTRAMPVQKWPRVYRSRDSGYCPRETGVRAARDVGEWEENRRTLIAYITRTAERVLSSESRG